MTETGLRIYLVGEQFYVLKNKGIRISLSRFVHTRDIIQNIAHPSERDHSLLTASTSYVQEFIISKALFT